MRIVNIGLVGAIAVLGLLGAATSVGYGPFGVSQLYAAPSAIMSETEATPHSLMCEEDMAPSGNSSCTETPCGRFCCDSSHGNDQTPSGCRCIESKEYACPCDPDDKRPYDCTCGGEKYPHCDCN